MSGPAAAVMSGLAAAAGGLAEGVRIWVREILIVLFLAGVLEMLLPETDTKRFARVAIGFFVVLAVGGPLFALVGGDAALDRGLAGLGAWEFAATSTGTASSADDPLHLGAELRDASRERALFAARAALETQIAALAERDPEVTTAEAAVALVSDPSSPSYGALETVRLKVWMARDSTAEGPPAPEEAGGPEEDTSSSEAEGGAPGAGAEGGARPPVEPVIVRVDPIITGWGATEGATAGGGGDLGGAPPSESSPAAEAGTANGSRGTGAASALAQRLRSQLVLLLGVPPGGISVEVWP